MENNVMFKLNFRGIETEIIDERIRTENREPGKFYAELRHKDSDWGFPITVEPKVAVNFWGTMVSPVEMNYPDSESKFIKLTREESNQILEIVSGY